MSSKKTKLYKKVKPFREKLGKLKRYTTKQEKDFLLLEEDATLTQQLKTVSDVKADNEYEALAFLFKLREISVSNLVEIPKSCSCGYINSFTIDINDMFNFTPEFIPNYEMMAVGIFMSADEIINTNILDSLIIKDLKTLNELIFKRSQEIFSPKIIKECQKCNTSLELYFNPASLISKSNPAMIYKEYVDISYYSSITKQDIDSMYPFEREIFLSLLSEKLKEDPKMKL